MTFPLTDQQIVEAAAADLIDEATFETLFEYYLDNNLMPYGVAKARTGDPYHWIAADLAERAKRIAA